MRPSTARQRNIEMEGEGEENMSDEEVAKQLALSERKSVSNKGETSSALGRPMTSRTRKRMEEDEAIAWQLQYEQELMKNTSTYTSITSTSVPRQQTSSANMQQAAKVETRSAYQPAQITIDAFKNNDSIEFPDDNLDDYNEEEAFIPNNSIQTSLKDRHRNEDDNDYLSRPFEGDLETALNVEFDQIDRFQPAVIEILPKLVCFIPEYTPAIGDLDPMIKVSLPAGYKFDDLKLGMDVLDEPSVDASDPAAIHLQVKSTMKVRGSGTAKAPVSSLDPKKPEFTKALAKWCQSVLDIHSKLNPDRVFYSKRMPTIEVLMNEWSSPLGLPAAGNENTDEVWREFRKKVFDGAGNKDLFSNLNISLEELAQISCLLVDIPVHKDLKSKTTTAITTATKTTFTETAAKNPLNKSLIECLHVFFSLYLEFRSSAHFAKLNTNGNISS